MQRFVVAAAVKTIRVSDSIQNFCLCQTFPQRRGFGCTRCKRSMQTKAKAEPFKIFLSPVMSIKECPKPLSDPLAIISLMPM
jgi:hypothetical protein